MIIFIYRQEIHTKVFKKVLVEFSPDRVLINLCKPNLLGISVVERDRSLSSHTKENLSPMKRFEMTNINSFSSRYSSVISCMGYMNPAMQLEYPTLQKMGGIQTVIIL